MSVTPDAFYYSDEINNTPNIFYNTLLGVSIAVEDHFKNLLFKGDISRIIYASDGYAFKERSRKHESLLDIPFMNYYLTDISRDTGSRYLWNNEQHVRGLRDIDDYQSSFGKPIRLVPVRLSFEASVFFSQPFDAMYAYQQLENDSTNEIILYSTFETEGGQTIRNSNFVTYEPIWSPEYTEQEWLEKNKLTPIGINFDVITYLIYTDTDPISISKEVILDFIESKNLIEDVNADPSTIDTNRIVREYLTSP